MEADERSTSNDSDIHLWGYLCLYTDMTAYSALMQ